jgi:transcriptional regulator with GAF, ATPase, and Fis domain
VLLTPDGAAVSEEFLSEHLRAATKNEVPPGCLQIRTSRFEHAQITAALERAHGVKTHAANELGITYRGLLKKMHRLGL